MRLKARLLRLECRLRPAEARDTAWSEERWLAEYEAMGRDGLFRGEPEFGAALERYRQALAAVHAQADPPWDSPGDFLPYRKDLPDLRLNQWRTRERFPEVMASWDWLAEMFDRAANGIPAVTRAEFADLAAWFRDNDARLDELAGRSQLLDVGGRRESCANLRYRLGHGPEASGAGLLAEDLRRLRVRYGAEGTGTDGRSIGGAAPPVRL
jgi:hypothetical protein